MTLLILILIWISNSMFIKIHIPSYFQLFILIFVLLIYIFFKKRKIEIQYKSFIVIFIFDYIANNHNFCK